MTPTKIVTLQEKSLRIGVFGAFASGKTRFILSACGFKDYFYLDYGDHRYQVYWDAEKELIFKAAKKYYCALDMGTICERDLALYLFGNPSTRNLDMRWFTEQPYLIENLAGMVIIMDSARYFPINVSENVKNIEEVQQHNIPYVVAANCQDIPKAQSPETIRKIFNIDPHIKVLPCVAHDIGSVSFVLWNLLTILPPSPERDVFAEKIKKNIPAPTLQWADK